MIIHTTLNLFLCVFGLSETMPPRANSLIRLILVVMNLLSMTNGVTYFVESSRFNFMRYFRNFAYFHKTVSDALVYFWRLKTGDLHMTTRHKQSRRFEIVFWVVLFANVGILVSTIVYLVQELSPGVMFFESQQWRIFFFITEVSTLLTQFQKFIVCLEMAMVVQDTAAEIKAVALERLDDFELGELCRAAENKCASLSEKLGLPLTLMHVDYFLHLMTEIPALIASGEFRVSYVYHFCREVKMFVELSTVVNAGESFLEATKRLAREVRKRGCASKDPKQDVHLFTKYEHSISFGLGNRLTYKSCSCFLGLSWGFLLTVYQISSDTGKCACL